MYAFAVPLVLGLGLAGASAFTAAFSRRWGEHGGRLATAILRNLLGLPLAFIGFVLAWRTPAPWLVTPGTATQVLGWLLIVAGAGPVIWGHVQLGWRTHMPSVEDTLVRQGLYAYVRHPIYGGIVLWMLGVALLRPSRSIVLACAIVVAWLAVQARLEEVDLVQRLPGYRAYMAEVPRFVPRLSLRQP